MAHNIDVLRASSLNRESTTGQWDLPNPVSEVAQRVLQEASLREKPLLLLDKRFAHFDWEKMKPTEKGAYLSCIGSILSTGAQNAPEVSTATEQMSSHLWRYVGSKEGIGEYHLRDEYDSTKTEGAEKAIEQKQQEISPAVEVLPKNAKHFFDTEFADRIILDPTFNPDKKEISLRDAYKRYGLELFRFAPELFHGALMSLVYEELGFRVQQGSDGKILFLPDVKTFMTRWANLQQKNPGLEDFTVLVMSGIAPDEIFLRAYFIYTALLSVDKEFVHDMTSHIARLILFLVMSLVEGKIFEEYKHKVDRDLFALYKLIYSAEHHQSLLDQNFLLTATELSMLKMSLGALADFIWAQSKPTDISERAKAFVRCNLRSTDFIRAATEAFGSENLRRLELVWDKLELATAPLYGPPNKLDPKSVEQLFIESPNLTAVADSENLYFRDLTLPYSLQEQGNGYKLVVNSHGHLIEKDLGKQRVIPPEILREISKKVSSQACTIL